MRVPPTIADEVLEQVRPLLPAGLALSRVGSHSVNIQTAGHEVVGFVQAPWPFPPGPKRFRIKSALVDFTGSLCDIVTEATKHDWPGSNRAIAVSWSRHQVLLTVTSTGRDLTINVDTKTWN